MKDNSSGITGILGIAVCVGLFLAARKFFPSLATLMLWLAGIAGVVIVVLIGLVIYFSVTGNRHFTFSSSTRATVRICTTAVWRGYPSSVS